MKHLVYLLLFISHLATAQTIFKGQVIDAATKEPLPYVNVGIVGRSVGTVTDEEGRFQLPLEAEYNKDSVKISMIGYNSRSWSVYDLKYEIKDSVLRLTKSQHELKQVEISDKRLRAKILGSTTTSQYFTGGFTSNDLGNEVAVKINLKGTAYLDKFNFSIAQNNCDSLLFRVNIYSIKNDMPDSSLLHENILVSTSIKSGVITVDLAPYGLRVTDDFIIGIEYIKPCSERYLTFSAAFLGSIYSRTTSQGDWEKLKGFDLGFNVRVLR